jgi:hypothetical protein
VADDLSMKSSTSAPVSDGVFERWLQQPTAWAAHPGEGGETSTSKLAVPMVLIPWSPPSNVGIIRDSVYPGGQDPNAQVGPNTWIMEIRTYLKDSILPEDNASTDQIARLAKRYTLVEGDLYRRGTNGILIRCITWEEGCELLTEIHGGECGNHTSSCMLVGKAFWHGFYWPTTLQDTVELVKSCRACHVDPHTGADAANDPAIMALHCMGARHHGAIPPRCRRIPVSLHRHRQVQEWLEATPVVKIKKQSIVKFIKSIIYRFGVLNRIITDNGSQFTSSAFQGYCEDLGIQICYASVAHPESIGQVERANAEILKGLKTRTYDGLKKHGKKWIDDLLCALWGNRTLPRRAMGEMPFFMVYRAEAVLPPEVTMGSHRVKIYDEAMQDQLRRKDIDLVDERTWQSAIKNARYHKALKHYQERFVCSREIQVDDLVLWQVLTREGANKLSPG